MNEKKDKLSWIILGLVIFIVFMSMYLYLKPKYLPSPDETLAGPLPSYLNMQTAKIAFISLIGSLLLAFGIHILRKKLDSELLEENEKPQKPQKQPTKRLTVQKV